MFFSRISFKLALIIAISLVGMLAMGPIALYTMRAQMMTDRQAKTQQMVDIGYGILAHYQKMESDGKLSKVDAQAAAMNEIRGLRYDKVEYFWINDMTPKMVMHPIRPELDGKDLSEKEIAKFLKANSAAKWVASNAGTERHYKSSDGAAEATYGILNGRPALTVRDTRR